MRFCEKRKKMFHIKIIIVFICLMKLSVYTFAEPFSRFRILAPQFVCPKDEETVLEKPDNTVITLQTADPELRIEWLVRWMPLVAPTQRFTLMVWQTVRALEKQLNKAQTDPNVYIIENSELLSGVNYIFNVTAISKDGTVEQPKTFNIDNTQGDNKLMIEGRNDMVSIILVGAQTAYVDDAFTIDAEVTTCYPTQDYYFSWSVSDVESQQFVNVSHVHSSKLEIAPFSLKVDLIYNINCKVLRQSNEDLITQTNLPFKVASRGLEVHLSVDYLVVSTNYSFSMESLVISHDYYETPLTYQWWCLYQNEDFNYVFNYEENGTLSFPNGLPFLGEYVLFLRVSILEQEDTANATINAVEHILPILQITPVKRQLNEGSVISLIANSSNVAPTCSLSWYFADEEYIKSYQYIDINATYCDDCEHGQPLSDVLTIYSLEEQFLSELTDFTNETEWRQVTTTMQAEAGRARILARCGCSLTFNCETLGTVHADIWFEVNESPKVGKVTISPESGIALESIFRISTLTAIDADAPLKYTFYCKVGENDSLLLASHFDHRAVETILPFVVEGTEVWVEVCDSLGACSNGTKRKIVLSPGEGRTVDRLIEDAMAHVRRCELDLLGRVAVSAIVTYTNTKQLTTLDKFSDGLQKSISTIGQSCIDRNYNKYSELLFQLARIGFDTSNLIN